MTGAGLKYKYQKHIDYMELHKVTVSTDHPVWIYLKNNTVLWFMTMFFIYY